MAQATENLTYHERVANLLANVKQLQEKVENFETSTDNIQDYQERVTQQPEAAATPEIVDTVKSNVATQYNDLQQSTQDVNDLVSGIDIDDLLSGLDTSDQL